MKTENFPSPLHTNKSPKLKNMKSLRDFSASPSKSEMRATFLSVLERRQEKRLAPKLREESERIKTFMKWGKNKIEEKNKKINDFFSRLSEIKKSPEDEEADKLRNFLEEKIKKSKEVAEKMKEEKIRKSQTVSPAKRQQEYLQNKLKEMDEIKNKRLSLIEKKIERSEFQQAKKRENIFKSMQVKKEIKEKQILRSKVYKTLYQDAEHHCDRYKREEIRFSIINEAKKEMLQEKNIKDLSRNLSVGRSHPTKLPKLFPDELLYSHFTEGQLRQVYYISLLILIYRWAKI